MCVNEREREREIPESEHEDLELFVAKAKMGLDYTGELPVKLAPVPASSLHAFHESAPHFFRHASGAAMFTHERIPER